MGCKLIQNIQHNCEYNPGGISDIYLLDINDFEHYKFENDGLFDSCFVEDILKKEGVDFIQLDVVNESAFTEQNEGGIYKQELQTFIRSLSGLNTSRLLLASSQKYLVVYRTHDDKAFSFGLDGGASVTFDQQSGKVGEAPGYQLSISKSSVYPQFEIDVAILYDNLLASENDILMVTEDDKYFIELEKIDSKPVSKWIEVTKAWDEEDLPNEVIWNPENTPYFQMWHLDNYVPEMQEPFILRRIVYHSTRDYGMVRVTMFDENDEKILFEDYPVTNKGLNVLNLEVKVDRPVRRFSFAVERDAGLRMANGVTQEKYGPIHFRWTRYSNAEIKDWSLGIGVYIERI